MTTTTMRILEMVVVAATKPRGGQAPSFWALQLRLTVMREIKSPEAAKSRVQTRVSSLQRLQGAPADGKSF